MFEIDDAIIFCSGTMDISYEVMRQFKVSNDKSIVNLSSIAKYTYETYKHNYLSPTLEILYLKNDKGVINNFQISYYNDFSIVENIVDEGIGIFAGGVQTKEALSFLEEALLHSSAISIEKTFSELFDHLSCEEIGGFLKVFKVDSHPQVIFQKKIIEYEALQRINTNYNQNLVIAEMVLGKIILGERVVIGDTTGVFTIEGSKLTIQDRCKREVVKLGLLEENPDKFGLRFNRFEEPNVCGNDKVLNKFTFDNADGFKLERNRNGSFEKTLYTSPDGDLFMKGNFQAGEGENVLRIDKDGFAVGASIWSQAPFRANYQGQVWMVGADISDSVVVDSKFQVGSGNRIVVIDQNGLRLGSADENTANAVIRMDGSARFKNVEITKPDGTKLMNSLNGDLHLNNFSIIGAGMVDAQLMAANIFAGDSGVITDLTAGRLSTLTNAAISDWSNYITIEGNKARWITGKVTQGEQKKLPDGRLLYWETSAQSGKYTINETPWPVYVYDTSQNQKVKMEDGFEGSGDASTPYRKMGIGDGATETSGVGWIKKPNGSFDFIYGASNTGKERSLKLGDEGVFVTSDTGKINLMGKQIDIIGDQGDIKISNGKASIVLSADGKITFNGTRFDFNTP
ncbi:hypothetical protein [Paenibacillus polymyxa]|uniref:hypothetical protein n=1 Tax=Paenibacillus polymyxa TaxID=1406 RepID=UPI002AB5165A|nr:hypothetical protein [Paenibacillus polymyxa]MDY8021276.1 hypothetical protein [Paenibacillus polymyxa]